MIKLITNYIMAYLLYMRRNMLPLEHYYMKNIIDSTAKILVKNAITLAERKIITVAYDNALSYMKMSTNNY